VRVKWLPDAIEDLTAIREYIATDKPASAEGVAHRIRSTVDYLRDHPGIGRPGRIHGTRELVIAGLPYVVPYRVKREVIEILGVFHTSREWPTEEGSKRKSHARLQ
jgi:toxin ParE1/3/4